MFAGHLSSGSGKMKIVVASRNPVKIGATTQAFKTLFPDEDLDVTSADVDSGAGDQPDSDAGTRQGARTRALKSREAVPDADFWVGLEGGVEVIDGQLMAFAWMAVQGRIGDVSEARSTTLPLPPAVKELVAGGMELGEANDRVFSTVNSKQGGGAYGLLTDGLYTREGIYAQTMIIALIPFVNPLYPQSMTSP
jgi:inosine/xanthosine triphosphatase